jgi:hypothetical protein
MRRTKEVQHDEIIWYPLKSHQDHEEILGPANAHG